MIRCSQNPREVQLLGQAADLAKAAAHRELSREMQGAVMGRDPTARPVQQVPKQTSAFVFPPRAQKSVVERGQ